MATPVRVFAEIAGRYGVDPTNEEVVENFYVEVVENFYVEVAPKLPEKERQAIFDELLARDGEPA